MSMSMRKRDVPSMVASTLERTKVKTVVFSPTEVKPIPNLSKDFSRQKLVETINQVDAEFPAIDKTFKYGTYGFRASGDELERVFYRVGLLMGLKAKLTSRIGVMVTASHNPKDDNGIKIVEASGSMLD